MEAADIATDVAVIEHDVHSAGLNGALSLDRAEAESTTRGLLLKARIFVRRHLRDVATANGHANGVVIRRQIRDGATGPTGRAKAAPEKPATAMMEAAKMTFFISMILLT